MNMKRMAFAAVFGTIVGSLVASVMWSRDLSAEEIFRIEVGSDYDRYSNQELKRRVWQLERAVYQLQARIYQLESKPIVQPVVAAPVAEWTCHMQNFGKTHVSTGRTRAAALADVLKKCSDDSNAIHCSESKVKCDKE